MQVVLAQGNDAMADGFHDRKRVCSLNTLASARVCRNECITHPWTFRVLRTRLCLSSGVRALTWDPRPFHP